MQITTKRLKQIIVEEMRKLNEIFGDEWAGVTDAAAEAHGAQDIEGFKALVELLIGRHGHSAHELKNIIDEVEGGYTSELDSNIHWDANDDQNRQMTADSAEDRAYNRYDPSYPESKYRYQESRKKRNK